LTLWKGLASQAGRPVSEERAGNTYDVFRIRKQIYGLRKELGLDPVDQDNAAARNEVAATG
jgi:hypothetical protein